MPDDTPTPSGDIAREATREWFHQNLDAAGGRLDIPDAAERHTAIVKAAIDKAKAGHSSTCTVDEGYCSCGAAPAGEVAELISEALYSFRLQHQQLDDGGGVPLVDALTPDGDESIARGNEEIERLAEAIGDATAVPPATVAELTSSEARREGREAKAGEVAELIERLRRIAACAVFADTRAGIPEIQQALRSAAAALVALQADIEVGGQITDGLYKQVAALQGEVERLSKMTNINTALGLMNEIEDEVRKVAGLRADIARLTAEQKCERQSAANAIVEIARLTAIVERLPKAADGVAVVPGDKVWCPAFPQYKGEDAEGSLLAVWTNEYGQHHVDGCDEPVERHYSTREAWAESFVLRKAAIRSSEWAADQIRHTQAARAAAGKEAGDE